MFQIVSSQLCYHNNKQYKTWSPLNKSAQFSSIYMRSSQSCPFLLHYRSRTIISFDRCISFEKKGEHTRTTHSFPISVQQLQYVHYLYYGRHLDAINDVERLSLRNDIGKSNFISVPKPRWKYRSRLGLHKMYIKITRKISLI